jgi:hypothetical protein
MSLSESTSAQVQAILEAAEQSAAAITREAEAEAARIRSAASESRQDDLSGVLELVATLRRDLDALEARLQELQRAPAEPAPAAAKPAPAKPRPRAVKPAAAAPPPPPEPPPAAEAAPEPPAADPGADAEGARLIALNMALNGQPREEADRYLAENFELGDRAALLDDVYASVEG